MPGDNDAFVGYIFKRAPRFASLSPKDVFVSVFSSQSLNLQREKQRQNTSGEWRIL